HLFGLRRCVARPRILRPLQCGLAARVRGPPPCRVPASARNTLDPATAPGSVSSRGVRHAGRGGAVLARPLDRRRPVAPLAPAPGRASALSGHGAATLPSRRGGRGGVGGG